MIINSGDNLTPLVVLAFTGAALSLGCPIGDLDNVLKYMSRTDVANSPSVICVQIIDAMNNLDIRPHFTLKGQL